MDLHDTEAGVDAQDERGQTALHRAAFRLDVKEVNRLLARGADTEVADVNGATPLLAAARWSKHFESRDTDEFHNMKQVMISLVEKGADIDVLRGNLPNEFINGLETFKPESEAEAAQETSYIAGK